ncbi:hypothetical protein A3F37_01730 [Candidatus Saccharibacteria bacterium RIFCSPHIGHO2_12_FULL_41_12]|nr:MAG: hypothetical protein A3F37_01730 [Candidatus Saccharibacteria bacterium RIFCSPHIGHO2_12_FULL_41_12]
MSHSNTTSQVSSHEQARTPAEIAKVRFFGTVSEAVNNVLRFSLPAEEDSQATELNNSPVSIESNSNTTSGQEVNMLNETQTITQEVSHDPVSGNATVDGEVRPGLGELRNMIALNASSSHTLQSDIFQGLEEKL